MSTNVYTTYSPRANAPDSGYPFGSIKNESVPGADDGTPVEKAWANNIEGFHQAMLSAAGVTPNNIPDTAIASQIYDALLIAIRKNTSAFATDTGAVNAYVVSLTPALTARSEGQVIRFKVANTNNGASTVNDGVGIVPLVGGAHSALQGGELVAGGDAWVQWNSTVGTGSYVLLFCAGAPMQVATGVQPKHAVNKGQLDTATALATETIAGISRKATDAEEIAGVSDGGFLTPAGLRNALNAIGSAPIFAARAWASFKQVGTQSVFASGNILSITDVAVGRSTLTFATAMQDTSYVAAGLVSTAAGSSMGIYSTNTGTVPPTKLVGSCQIGCWDANNTLGDFYDAGVAFFR